MNIKAIKNLSTSASRAQFSLLNTTSLQFFHHGLSSILGSKLLSVNLHVILCKNWPETCFYPLYVKKSFKGERVKVMVWGCFTGERLGPLIVCDDGGIGADEYVRGHFV